MSFTDKIDVLDMLIEILQDHEKKLDELVGRLEEAAADLSVDEKLRVPLRRMS